MSWNDLLYYGAMGQEQANDAIENFNMRWKRLCDIQDDLAERFVDVLLEQLNDDDRALFMPYVEEVRSWQHDINERLDIAEDKHLSEYAMHLKKLTMVSLNLSLEYKVYNDITSFDYNVDSRIIELNGEALYFLG